MNKQNSLSSAGNEIECYLNYLIKPTVVFRLSYNPHRHEWVLFRDGFSPATFTKDEEPETIAKRIVEIMKIDEDKGSKVYFTGVDTDSVWCP